MIKIAVVDDNSFFLNQFCAILENCLNQDKIIDSFSSSLSFLNNPDKYTYDIIFLDIDMPDINGFELAENLKIIKPDIVIVFISNYDNYISSSFEYTPFCFIRKQYLEQDLNICLQIYHKKYGKVSDYFSLITYEKELRIALDSILYFEKMGHDLFLKTNHEKHRIKRLRDNELSLTKIASELENKGFIRVHRSFLVNVKSIYIIQKNEIILKNKEKIPINFRKANDIKNVYQQFLISEE